MIELYSNLTGKPKGTTRTVDGAEYYGKGYEDSDLRIPSMRLVKQQLDWEPKTTLKEAMEMTMKVCIVGALSRSHLLSSFFALCHHLHLTFHRFLPRHPHTPSHISRMPCLLLLTTTFAGVHREVCGQADGEEIGGDVLRARSKGGQDVSETLIREREEGSLG